MGLSSYYKGSGTNVYALANKEYEKVGATIHTLSEKIDGGKILKEIKFNDYKEVTSYNEIQTYLLKDVVRFMSDHLNSNTLFSEQKLPHKSSKFIYGHQINTQLLIQCEENVKLIH